MNINPVFFLFDICLQSQSCFIFQRAENLGFSLVISLSLFLFDFGVFLLCLEMTSQPTDLFFWQLVWKLDWNEGDRGAGLLVFGEPVIVVEGRGDTKAEKRASVDGWMDWPWQGRGRSPCF